VGFDRGLDFSFYRVEVETGWILHRRVFNSSHRQLGHSLLNHDKAPELACIEIVSVAKRAIVYAFAAEIRRALEWILAEVCNRGHVGIDFLARPAPWLLQELELEIIDTNRTQLWSAEIEKFVSRRRSSAFKQGPLVVPIKF
jgi:hypothetical protein